MKKIDCTKNCPKTKMMRNSRFCDGFAVFKNGKIIYSCEENIDDEHEAIKNFYTCDFYNMGIEEKCYECPLRCKKNKSRVAKAKDLSIKRAERMVDELAKNYPLTGESVRIAKNRLSDELTEQDKISLEYVNLANKILNHALSGKNVNIAALDKLIRELKRGEGL